MFGYIFGRTLENNTYESNSSFSTFKFVAIAGSVSLILFGTGYALYGLGSALRPISDIVEELHDSDSSSASIISDNDTSSTSSTESISDTDDAEESN